MTGTGARARRRTIPGCCWALLSTATPSGCFQPQPGACDLPFGSVPLHRRQRASRPRHHRHIPPPLPRTDRGAVRAGARRGPRDGVLKLGTVALDGTKIHANASRHSALSHEHASRIEAQLKAEVADLLGKAEAADQAEVPNSDAGSRSNWRREKRLTGSHAPRLFLPVFVLPWRRGPPSWPHTRPARAHGAPSPAPRSPP